MEDSGLLQHILIPVCHLSLLLSHPLEFDTDAHSAHSVSLCLMCKAFLPQSLSKHVVYILKQSLFGQIYVPKVLGKVQGKLSTQFFYALNQRKGVGLGLAKYLTLRYLAQHLRFNFWFHTSLGLQSSESSLVVCVVVTTHPLIFAPLEALLTLLCWGNQLL